MSDNFILPTDDCGPPCERLYRTASTTRAPKWHMVALLKAQGKTSREICTAIGSKSKNPQKLISRMLAPRAHAPYGKAGIYECYQWHASKIGKETVDLYERQCELEWYQGNMRANEVMELQDDPRALDAVRRLILDGVPDGKSEDGGTRDATDAELAAVCRRVPSVVYKPFDEWPEDALRSVESVSQAKDGSLRIDFGRRQARNAHSKLRGFVTEQHRVTISVEQGLDLFWRALSESLRGENGVPALLASLGAEGDWNPWAANFVRSMVDRVRQLQADPSQAPPARQLPAAVVKRG